MKRFLSIFAWSCVALPGVGALGAIALHRGEALNATWFVIAAVCSYLVAFRVYSTFIAARLLALDDSRATPAERRDASWIRNGHCSPVPRSLSAICVCHFAPLEALNPVQTRFASRCFLFMVGVDRTVEVTYDARPRAHMKKVSYPAVPFVTGLHAKTPVEETCAC